VAGTVSLVLLPPTEAAAALLVVAGGAKVMGPHAARASLAAAGARVPELFVKVLGAAEMALGLLVIVQPTRAAVLLLAAAYGCFALFVVVLVRRGRRGLDCGCFGSARTEATLYHASLNALVCAICLAAAVAPPPSAGWVFDQAPLTAAALCAGIGAVAYAAYLAFTALQGAWGSYTAGGS
jgi:hypothetical protein